MQPATPLLLLPEPPANLTNDDAVKTPLSEVGRVTAQNLTIANESSIRLEKLQRWISLQQAEWEKLKK